MQVHKVSKNKADIAYYRLSTKIINYKTLIRFNLCFFIYHKIIYELLFDKFQIIRTNTSISNIFNS